MKRILGKGIGTAAAVAALALWGGGAAGTAARAQVLGGPTVPKPFALKLGSYIPTGSEARKAGGSGMLLLEADYTIQNLIDSNSQTVVSIGVTGRDDLYMIPFTVSQVFRDRDNTIGGRGVYYGAGLGVYVVKLDLPDTSDETKNLLGGFLMAGLDLQQNLFAEVRYHYIANYDKKNINGFQLTVGTRF